MFITKILKSEIQPMNSSSFSAAAIGQFPKEFQLTFSDRFDKGFILIFIILFIIFMPITGWLSTIGPPEVSLDDYEDLLAQYTESILDIEPAEILDEPEEEIAGIDEGTGEEEAGEEETEAEQEVSANEQSGPTAEQVQERRKQRLASQRAAAAAAASSAAAEAAAGVGVFKELVGKGGGYGGAASSGGLSAGAAGAGGGLDAVLSQVGGVKSGSGTSSLGGGGGTLGGAGGLGALGGAGGGKGIGGGTAAGSLKGSGKIGNLKPPRVKGKAAKNAYRNPNAIAAVMNSYQSAVQFCYETEKRVNPKLKGKISIVFDIIESGRIKGARIKSSSMRNRKVETCILRNVRKWKFEKIDPGSGAVSVERTYIFQ